MLEQFNLEPIKIKKFKLETDEDILQQRPIVFHGDSVYVFIEKCNKTVNKFIRDVCDPISKPQKVHEYKITAQSLVRAQALRYKKDDIIKTFQSNMRNKGSLPAYVQQKVRQFVGQIQCQLYLYWTGQECKYIFKIEKNLFQNIRPDVESYLTPFKQPNQPENNSLTFEVQKFQHIDLEKILWNKCMPVRADRIVQAYVPQGNKIRTSSYCHHIQINLKSFTELREYQAQALAGVVKVENEKIRAKSGYIVLPCGAGKTLLGISILCKIKKQALIVCSSDSGTQQWKREIQKWTQSFPREHIIIMTSSNPFEFQRSQHGQIFISTYSFLKTHINAKKDIKRVDEWLVNKPWGLLIYDQCQTLPATQNRQIAQSLSAQVKIGLTATPLREDNQIKALSYTIGPQLYVGDWKNFVQQGYLANPKCIQIRTQLTPYFKQKYIQLSKKTQRDKDKESDRRQICYKTNPNKIKALFYLLHYHQQLNDQILVFNDDLVTLKFMAEKLKKPILFGNSPPEQRMFIFDMFRSGKIKTLFVSRVGDEAIDLPNANVGIQFNIQHGSRKQMLQRLGRIMRQKQASSSLSYNAMFYTITTYDTLQWTYFFKRYKCLIDEGFHYDLRLFEFRTKEIDDADNILSIDPKVKLIIDDKYKRILDNEEDYWNRVLKDKADRATKGDKGDKQEKGD